MYTVIAALPKRLRTPKRFDRPQRVRTYLEKNAGNFLVYRKGVMIKLDA